MAGRALVLAEGSGEEGTGILCFNGDITNTTGTVHIELAGTQSSDYDRIMLRNGHASRTENGTLIIGGGALEVTAINGFKPVYRDAFQILDCNAINGTFDTVSLPGGNERWDTSELYSAGIIRYALPPGTLFFVR